MNGTCCRVWPAALCLVLIGVALLADDRPATAKTDQVDPRWLASLDPPDRACLEERIGYAPPAFTSALRWPRG